MVAASKSGTIEAMTGPPMKVFISHSYEDRAVAVSLAYAAGTISYFTASLALYAIVVPASQG